MDPKSVMETVVLLGLILAVLLLLSANLFLCFWIGFQSGLRKQRNTSQSATTAPAATPVVAVAAPTCVAQVASVVTVPATPVVLPVQSDVTVTQVDPPIVVVPSAEPQPPPEPAPVIREHKLIGVTCLPHDECSILAARVTETSPAAKSYDSSVFTEEGLDHHSE